MVEAHDEWQAIDRRYLGETTMALLTSPPTDEVATRELMTARSKLQSLREWIYTTAGDVTQPLVV